MTALTPRWHSILVGRSCQDIPDMEAVPGLGLPAHSEPHLTFFFGGGGAQQSNIDVCFCRMPYSHKISLTQVKVVTTAATVQTVLTQSDTFGYLIVH